MAYGSSGYRRNGYVFAEARGYSISSEPPCAEIGFPSFTVQAAGVVGVGYQWPPYALITGSPTRNPTQLFAKIGSEVIAGPGPIDNTTLARAYTAPEIGNSFVDIYLENCFGADFAGTFNVVQDAGWAAGEPKLLISGTPIIGYTANPTTVDFASWFYWTEDVDTVVIKDTADDTTLYSGPIAGSMVNNTYYTCVKFGEGAYRTISIAATNGVGTMTLLTGPLQMDNLGTCP